MEGGGGSMGGMMWLSFMSCSCELCVCCLLQCVLCVSHVDEDNIRLVKKSLKKSLQDVKPVSVVPRQVKLLQRGKIHRVRSVRSTELDPHRMNRVRSTDTLASNESKLSNRNISFHFKCIFTAWMMSSCPSRRTQDTWEPSSVCCSRMSTWIRTLVLPPSRKPTPSPKPPVRPGVGVTAALPPLSPRRSCAAGGAPAPASPPPLCSSSWCSIAPCWRLSYSTGTPCLLLRMEASPRPCVTARTDSTSAGGSGSRPPTPTLPSPPAACGGSGSRTRARTGGTAASHRPGGCHEGFSFSPFQCSSIDLP